MIAFISSEVLEVHVALKKITNPKPWVLSQEETGSTAEETHAISLLVVAPQTTWAPGCLLSLPAVMERPELQISRSKHPLSTAGNSTQWFCPKNNLCPPLPDSRQGFIQLFSSISQYFHFSDKQAWFRGVGCGSLGERSCKARLCFVASQNNLKWLQFTLMGERLLWWKWFYKIYMWFFSGSDLSTTVWILSELICTAQATSHQQNGLR